MIRKPLALLSVAASVGILAAGCGGSSTTTVTAAAPTTTTSASVPTTTTTSSNTGNTGSSTSATTAANPAVAQLVANCKSRISSASGLSSSIVQKLQALCTQAENGNEASARKAAAQVCTEIIKATVPQQAQQFALANCPKA